MNAKMKELLDKIKACQTRAKAFMADGENKDVAKAQAEMETSKALQAEYEVEKALYEAEKDNIPDDVAAPAKKEKKVSGFGIIAKMLGKKRLDDTEKALITGTNAADGENNLVPEDVKLEIVELRKTYKSAKELLTVIPTDTLSGGFNFESGTPAGLTDFDDGGDIAAETNPSFERKSFAIKWMGKLIAISNILAGNEKAGLMAYLNKWFVRNAIISENTKIFATLKTGKTAKALKGLEALKTSIIKDLDPSCLNDGVIVTNQTGFDAMCKETDAIGRPMLETNIADVTQKSFYGMPIQVFPDAQLANESGKAPIFYGSLKAGGYFIENSQLKFAVSEHFYFGKNQTALRVIEGFDTIQADGNAYIYGTYEPADAKVVSTKAVTV